MFSRVSSLFIAMVAFTIFAAAMPGGTPPKQTTTVTVTATHPPTSTPVSQCSTGSIQCCNSVQAASSPNVGLLAGLLGIVLGPITGLVGLTCSPLSVLGIGGTSCSAQTVCCTGNNFSGLIVLGCSPINLNL